MLESVREQARQPARDTNVMGNASWGNSRPGFVSRDDFLVSSFNSMKCAHWTTYDVSLCVVSYVLIGVASFILY